MLWLSAGALATSLLLVMGLVVLVAWNGLGYFWQAPVVQLELADGSRVLGEVVDRDPTELRIRFGNRDLGGADFRWIPTADVRAETQPADALVLEREEWGRFFGYPVAIRRGETVTADGAEAVFAALPAQLEAKRSRRRSARRTAASSARVARSSTPPSSRRATMRRRRSSRRASHAISRTRS
jgi:phosphate transport system permease protein